MDGLIKAKKSDLLYYRIEEAFCLFKCEAECTDLADWTIEADNGGTIRLCDAHRKEGGWL